MNRHDALERELTAWFFDTAAPRTPDYTTDIVQRTATVRQRPRWAFPERWLPVSVVAFRRRTAPSFPWRTVAALAILALLLAAVLVVGSQPRLPPPFGLARNGLIAYAKDGDILTVDPATGARKWITSGNEDDRDPQWSLDGTRMAFLRNLLAGPPMEPGGTIDSVVVVDREGNVIAKSRPIPGIDPDAVAWSPDGRSIAVGGNGDIYLVGAADGIVSWVPVAYTGLDLYWRPGDSREIVFQGRTADGAGLVLANVDDPASASLIAASAGSVALRPNGWTVDGRRVVYTRIDESADSISLRVLDVTTRAETVIDAGFAHVANDGIRLLAIDRSGKPCIAGIDGGPCIAIADTGQAYVGMHAAGAHWAPDDESIVVQTTQDRALLLDPTGGTGEQPAWVAAGAESWQRVAR
jgi:hypothetical protein